MSKIEVEKFGKEMKVERRQEATGWQRREIVGSIVYTRFSLEVHSVSVSDITDLPVVENQSAVNYFAPGILPKT